jgi:hypothetical protein
VLASGALPPAMPMVRIGGEHYWDGGMVSNTPLQHLLDNVHEDILVFQVDLFSARGPIPRDMFDVQARTKEIQYSSRTRLTTDHYMQLHRQRVRMRRLLAKIPDEGTQSGGPHAQGRSRLPAEDQHPAPDLPGGELRGAGTRLQVLVRLHGRTLGGRHA